MPPVDSLDETARSHHGLIPLAASKSEKNAEASLPEKIEEEVRQEEQRDKTVGEEETAEEDFVLCGKKVPCSKQIRYCMRKRYSKRTKIIMVVVTIFLLFCLMTNFMAGYFVMKDEKDAELAKLQEKNDELDA